MALSQKQIRYIQKQYPARTVEQLAQELNLTTAQVYQALGLHTELWSERFDKLIGYLFCALLVIAPFVFIDGVNEFADLPQRVCIQAVMAGLVVIWMLKSAVTGEILFPREQLFYWMIGLVLWSAISAAWAVNGYEAFYAISHWAACALGMLLIITVLYRKPWPDRAVKAVCIAGAGVAALGLCQQFFKVKWVPQPAPPSAVFGNANMAADYLSIVVPIVLALAIQRRRSAPGLAAGAITVLSALFIYYTHARAAYLGVACAAGWMGLLHLKRKPEKVRIVKAAALIVAAAALIGMAAVLASGKLYYLMSRAGSSAQYRATVWQNSFQMIKDRPVLGFGAGSFRISYGAYIYRAISDRAFTKAKQIRKTHNEYVQNAVELGLPGLVLFIAPLLYGLIMAWRLVPYGQKSHHDLLVSGLSGGLIGFIITAFFSFPWQRSMPPLMLAVCLGFLVVCRMQQGQTTGALVRCKAPKALMACLLVIALVMGAWLTRYNVRNILSDRYFQTALMMERKKRGEEALRAASTAHAYNPDRLDVMTTLGRAYLVTNNLEEGIKNLEEVCSKWPNNLNALILLGIGYTNIGRNDKALETFAQVLKIQPGTIEAKNIITTIKSRGKAFVNLQ